MAEDQDAGTQLITERDLRSSGLPSTMEMSPGLAIFFNDALYTRCKQIASHMSKADGMMPRHLIGKPEACFAVVSRAIVWKLDPFSVAMATYQTPGGSIGYMGVLIQSILETSGRIEGGINYRMVGDWNKVKGKFKLESSSTGKSKFPVPTWTAEDAKGLSVIVSAQVKAEAEPRELEFELIEAFPLNSPLWATAPHRQIKYTAVRAFANQAAPSLLMGVPFDIDPTGFYGEPMVDITPLNVRSEGEMVPPRPKHSDFDRKQPEPEVVQQQPEERAEAEAAKPADAKAGANKTHPPELEAAQPGPSAGWSNAEELLQNIADGIADVDDLTAYRTEMRGIIDGLENITEGERDVVRGQLSSIVLGEQAKRGKKKR